MFYVHYNMFVRVSQYLCIDYNEIILARGVEVRGRSAMCIKNASRFNVLYTITTRTSVVQSNTLRSTCGIDV